MSCPEKCSAEKDEVRVAAEGLIAAGKKGFVTCESSHPDYSVKVKFRSLQEAHAYHRALMNLTLSLADD